ncbi:HBR182Cp [Eremothecium sinecaudum]|uniref:HBR182Cp n=1 Tax=Eremothecium sinecaudum TaxID=45286 RepID=A0A109UWY5_9SACH|nr:HBR182Cp [Eremothecium sinecaudum]AMD19083.1 HBR182Cp [Eremothecium sinecaudum]
MSAPEPQGNNSIIEIESDPEEDQRIINQYRQTRLVPDRRLNRPRDASNRFVNADTYSLQLQNAEDGDDGDDLQIVNEVYLDDEGPIDGMADFVDLERNTPSSRLVVNYVNGETSEASREDDEIAIIEERTVQPTFLLNLPIGQTLRISGTIEDRPARRSFETQRTARVNLLRRAARGAQRLFMTDPDSDQNDETEANNDGEYLPQAVVRQRQQAAMQNRMQRQLRQRSLRQREHLTDPEVELLDPEIRSMFYHAETPHELRTMLNSRGIDANANSQNLVQLYMRFRSRQLNNWARQRAQDFYFRANTSSGREEPNTNHSLRPLRHQHPLNQQRAPFTSYVLARSLGNLGPWRHDLLGEDEEEVTQNIIDLIQAREERDLDNRKRKYMEDTKSQQQKFIERAQSLPDKYCASFDPTPKMRITMERNGKTEEVMVTDDQTAKNYIEIPVCCLCGVELGLGIPDDFKGISQVDRAVSFESLVSKYDFRSPYQALARPSVADRNLSKRTFVAHCGHTFCGRCFARINNAKKFSKVSKKRLAELRGPSHPDNYGPRICPTEGCKGQLRARGKMREVYF